MANSCTKEKQKFPLNLIEGKTIKIAKIETPFDNLVNEKQKEFVLSFTKLLSDIGFPIKYVKLPDLFSKSLNITDTIQKYELVKCLGSNAFKWDGKVSSSFRDYIQQGLSIKKQEYINAVKKRNNLINIFDELMSEFDILLTYPATGEAPKGLHFTGDATLCVRSEE